MELTTEQKTQFNVGLAALAAALPRFSREELEMMVVEDAEALLNIRQALPRKELLTCGLAPEIDSIVKENVSLKARIAELEQQVAELSKDKARLDWLTSVHWVDIKTRIRRSHRCVEARICFDHDGEGDEATIWGDNLREAIDAAIAQEQEHE